MQVQPERVVAVTTADELGSGYVIGPRLVLIEDSRWSAPAGRPPGWGRTATYRPEQPCQAWDLPRAVQRPAQSAEIHHASSTLNPGSGSVHANYVGPPTLLSTTLCWPKKVAEHTKHDATESRVADLYVKAAEQLGHDQAVIRMVGLYVLEHLA
ncbi:hypothetical protein [Streptosporangium sp. NPDC023615]|uniref:hypothetical protein n=1 Tax=Streptosporangium sp. NPDC023615 TaxID=3154794 RepID=UPI00341CA6D9